MQSRISEDNPALEALENLGEAGLTPDMVRNFDAQTIQYIYHDVLPYAIQRKDVKLVRLIEQVLAKHGWAKPNHVSGYWEPMDVPRNELQVRELFAHKLPEYGYQLVGSHVEFPDWLLVDTQGNFIYTEVEHRSYTFSVHGHDPTACDLIACWEHDWPQAPLPVLEFFSGQIIQPANPTVPAPNKQKAQVNFSTALSRHTSQKQRRESLVATEETLRRYKELQAQGVGYTEAVKLLAIEEGISREGIRARLRKSGLRGTRSNSMRREQVLSRLEGLVLDGMQRKEAIKQVAKEFDVALGTVYSHISRSK